MFYTSLSVHMRVSASWSRGCLPLGTGEGGVCILVQGVFTSGSRGVSASGSRGRAYLPLGQGGVSTSVSSGGGVCL